jgi:hypothetical protein
MRYDEESKAGLGVTGDKWSLPQWSIERYGRSPGQEQRRLPDGRARPALFFIAAAAKARMPFIEQASIQKLFFYIRGYTTCVTELMPSHNEIGRDPR